MKHYESPTLDCYEVTVEAGFAGSTIEVDDNTAESMTPVEW